MLGIKKLHILIIKQFALLFVGTFFISLFVLMMQFVWQYVDILIGKGLTLDIMAQFFWYMSLMMVPQALPLAILLSSLITFGNLSESSELTAIKAAGISLSQTLRPLAIIVVAIAFASFYFQNNIGPMAKSKIGQLMISMQQKSPELEIPEGIFYDGIPNCNIYVQKKDLKTGIVTSATRDENLHTFKEALDVVTNLNNWHAYLNLFAQAGYINGDFVAAIT